MNEGNYAQQEECMAEKTPSENEWIIMEILWNQNETLTAAEIIQQLKGIKDVSPKTIREIGRAHV